MKEHNRGKEKKNPLFSSSIFYTVSVDDQGKISGQGRLRNSPPALKVPAAEDLALVRRLQRLELTSVMFNLGHRVWIYCIYKSGRVNLHYKLFLFCQMEHANGTT